MDKQTFKEKEYEADLNISNLLHLKKKMKLIEAEIDRMIVEIK
jgi:hypothetical protein